MRDVNLTETESSVEGAAPVQRLSSTASQTRELPKAAPTETSADPHGAHNSEDRLDEALDETFPASDPIAISGD